MAYEPFEPALPIPVNFSVQDNKYEGKEKYPKKLRLFIPLESATEFVTHIMNMVEQKKYHKTGKVYDMRTGEREEVEGIYIYGNGKVGTFDSDEYGAYGTINPKKVKLEASEATVDVPANQAELSASEDDPPF